MHFEATSKISRFSGASAFPYKLISTNLCLIIAVLFSPTLTAVNGRDFYVERKNVHHCCNVELNLRFKLGIGFALMKTDLLTKA
jgi:hypothetical protein